MTVMLKQMKWFFATNKRNLKSFLIVLFLIERKPSKIEFFDRRAGFFQEETVWKPKIHTVTGSLNETHFHFIHWTFYVRFLVA